MAAPNSPTSLAKWDAFSREPISPCPLKAEPKIVMIEINSIEGGSKNSGIKFSTKPWSFLGLYDDNSTKISFWYYLEFWKFFIAST